MTDAGDQTPALQRLPSGISGLDTILRGGFFRGSLYIIRGAPGTGKTILANQVIFQAINQGGRAAYIASWARVTCAYLRISAHFPFSPCAGR